MSDMSLHNDPIRKDNEPEPKAFTHISTHISQENQRCITGIIPPIKWNNLLVRSPFIQL